jgi:AcrR family transcriptional regulator
MKRAYVQVARARAVEETGHGILAAAYTRFSTEDYDDVTLDRLAVDAGVSVQTVIRRFGSKEGVVRALAKSVTADIMAQRGQAPAGDLRAITANLIEHYEAEGDMVMHLLRQESRVGAFADATAQGKRLHAEWCARVFSPWMTDLSGVQRKRRLAQVVAICDVYVWHLLRQQRGLSRRETRLALRELLEGIL